MKHTDADKQLRVVRFTVAGHHFQIRPVRPARHRQNAHAQSVQPGKLDGPARLFHHDVVARTQQGTADDIQRVRGADRGDDLLWRSVHVQARELFRQRLSQPRIARWLAILE